MAVKDYNTDPAKNTAISGINIAENCPPGNVNNAIRQKMADTKGFYDEYTSFKGTTVSKSGDTVSGTLKVTGEIQNVARYAFRQVYGDYGTYWLRDTSMLYFMLTDAGNQYGSYNSFRPFKVNLTTGVADISGNAATATKLATARTISLTGGVTGSAKFDGSADVSISATVAASTAKRQVITASGTFTPTATGWYRVTCIGGGGAGGGSIWRGGLAGGNTTFGSLTARGGGGGGGCGISATNSSMGGAGGGAAGEVVTGFLKLTSGTAVTVTIGAGGLASTTNGTTPTGYNAGANISSSTGYVGGIGASGAQSGGSGGEVDARLIGSNGGNGGSNSTGYGGGGGGCGGASNVTEYRGTWGRGADNGKNGSTGSSYPSSAAAGGAGGPGAVILEWEV